MKRYERLNMAFPPHAWRDPHHVSNKMRPRVRCAGCGKLGCVTYWGPWCFKCNVERMDRVSATFEKLKSNLASIGGSDG